MTDWASKKNVEIDMAIAEHLDSFCWYAQGAWEGGEDDEPVWCAVRYLARSHDNCALCVPAKGDEPIDDDLHMVPEYATDWNEALRVLRAQPFSVRAATIKHLMSKNVSPEIVPEWYVLCIATLRQLCEAMLEAKEVTP